jgi:beta-lactamase regulating signal transducer with metallopeptidase domain
MIAAPDFAAIAQMSAERIVYCLAEGTLVAAFAGCLLRVLRGRNASTRFAVWFSAMAAIALLPLFGMAWSLSAGQAQSATLPARSPIALPSSWAFYLFAAWAGIAAVALARVGAGLVQICALRRSCVSVDISSLDPVLRETLSRSRTGRPVAFCISDLVQAPTALGLANPAVIMPAWLLQELSPAELNQVLVHELAHLRRWDDWTNLTQKIVKAVLFFHPAVWWIERRVTLEREMACDEAVLAETASPRAYAECLAHLAEKSFLRRTILMAQAAVGRVSQTSLRVAHILDVNRPAATTRVWKPAVSLVAVFAVACLAWLARTPQLVSFEPNVPPPLVGSAVAPARTAAMVFPNTPRTTVLERALMAQRPRAVRVKPASPGLDSLHSDSDLAFFQENVRFGPGGFSPEPEQVREQGADRATASAAVLVFVVDRESGLPGQAAYQICVWRITVLQTVSNPGRKNSSPKAI